MSAGSHPVEDPRRPDVDQKDHAPDLSAERLLAEHTRRSRLRAVAGSQGLGCPACRMCSLFTMSNIRAAFTRTQHESSFQTFRTIGGARRDRTDDLLNANQALSQLSYAPTKIKLAIVFSYLKEGVNEYFERFLKVSKLSNDKEY